MTKNYNPNPNATSNLSGWSKVGSSTTLTATSEGARWSGGSSGTGRGIHIKVPMASSGMVYGHGYGIDGMQVRRNSGTAQITSIKGDGTCWYDYSDNGTAIGVTGYAATDDHWASIFIPTGQFVNLGPWTADYWAGCGDWTAPSWSGAPADAKDDYFDFWIYAEDNKPFDFTIKAVNVYDYTDRPAVPVIDTNDATISGTIDGVYNSLTRTFHWNKLPNEPVETLEWNWGDGTAKTTGSALTASIQSPTHTYANPGVYTVTLTAKNSLGQSASDTIPVTVPWGTFQAGFTYQVDYPQVLVDASSSVAPSLSPITTYAWNWGDGQTGSGKTASHSYANPGTYNVTLTVSNPTVQRTSAVTRTITISAPPLPITAPQFRVGLFLDDPKAVTGVTTGLQAEMVPILTADEVKWNWTRSEVPTMSFTGPIDWLDRAIPGLTSDTLVSDIVVRLNFGAGWFEPPSARFIIDTVQKDPLNPQTRVTVNCISIAADDLAGLYFTPEIIGDAYTTAEIAAGYSRLYSNTTAGAALWDLLPVATTPGTGAPYLNFMNIDFSNTVDSKGQPWGTVMETFKVPPDSSGLDLLQSLIDNGTIDWFMQGNLLRVFNYRTGGKRSATDAIPELLAGRDVTGAPQEQSPIRSKHWGAIVVDSKGRPYVVTDTVSGNDSYQRSAYRGRRYVAVQADVGSSAAALAVAKPALGSLYRTKDGEMVRELRFYQDMPWMPYRDYWVGDTVYAPGPDGSLITVSVESITITQDSSNGLGGSLILGNAFAVNSLASKVASLQGGAGISVGQVGRDASAFSAYVQATASLNPTTTRTDVPGLSLSVYASSASDVFMVNAAIDFQYIDTDGGTAVGELLVDSSVQSAQVIYTGNGTRGTSFQQWRVTGLSPGNHTLKITGRVTSGSSYRINAQHSTLSYIRF